MSIIKLDLDTVRMSAPSGTEAWGPLEKFLSDMKNDRSSFFHLPDPTHPDFQWEAELGRIQPELASRIPNVDTFIHLGIGGSSLGAETIVRALAAPNTPTFHFLDNIDPDYLWNTLEQISPQRALLFVVTKSGGTMETLAQFLFIYKWFVKHLGEEEAKKHLVFCTDPQKGDLRKLSDQWKIPTFTIPPNLGGRFSALGPVGLFPALVAGVDCNALLKGASDYREHILEKVSRRELPEVADLAYRLVRQYTQNKRNITVLMPYSQRLKSFSAWFTQLWAESLGKKSKGITPVPSTGATDQHSILQLLRDGPQDKVVGFIEVAGFEHLIDLSWNGPKLAAFEEVSGITLNQLMDAEFNATKQVLTNNEKPNFTVTLPRLNANTLGQLFYFHECLTAIAGYYLDIDPFDQPGVEEGKRLTAERIRACKKGGLA